MINSNEIFRSSRSTQAAFTGLIISKNYHKLYKISTDNIVPFWSVQLIVLEPLVHLNHGLRFKVFWASLQLQHTWSSNSNQKSLWNCCPIFLCFLKFSTPFKKIGSCFSTTRISDPDLRTPKIVGRDLRIPVNYEPRI